MFLHCQFLCHALIVLIFIKIELKISYFCPPKNKIFKRWGLGPQTPMPLAARPQIPVTASPIADFWLRA